uniref:Uncharacterized protein n=1 Tax=Timema douglasi TaxID=61478 RepID=A0A7R8Z9V1_TIMDO|nr:unnamed protein product [Timema douglasi]
MLQIIVFWGQTPGIINNLNDINLTPLFKLFKLLLLIFNHKSYVMFFKIFFQALKHYRGYQTRKHYGPLLKASSDKMNTATASFMRPFCKKWKAKSIFQVLLMYRSARYQDLVYFSQQVHLYNQKAMSGLQASNVEVILEKVDPGGRASLVLPKKRQSVWKLPFRLDDLPFFDTTFMCDPLAATGYIYNKGCYLSMTTVKIKGKPIFNLRKLLRVATSNIDPTYGPVCKKNAATFLIKCSNEYYIMQESANFLISHKSQTKGQFHSQTSYASNQESQTNSTPDNSDKCVGADEDFIQIPYNRDPQLIADKERFSGSVQQKRDYNQTSQRKTTDDSPSNAQNYDYSRGVYKGIRKEPTSDAKNNRQFLRSDLPQPYRKKTSTVHNNSYGPVNNNDRFSRDLDNNPSDTSDSWDLPRTSSYGAKNEYNRKEGEILKGASILFINFKSSDIIDKVYKAFKEIVEFYLLKIIVCNHLLKTKFNYFRQGSISPRSKLKNPLEELKMKGRQASKDDNDTDEPPFNFQAMLRKTKINRASLRRGSDQALSSDMASNAQHIVSSNKSTDKRRGGTVVYNSSIRSESPPPRYGCLNPWQDNRNKRIIEEMGAEEEGSEEESEGISVITTTTMLAPGLVVQGQVAEL